jgi:hypothetical protein
MTGRMEKQGKPKTGFPCFSTAPLEIAAAIPTFPPRRLRVPSPQNQKRKELPGDSSFFFSSGSFFDEKMLTLVSTGKCPFR